jgi:uncharacterized protein
MANVKEIEFESGATKLRGVLHAPMHAPAFCVVISHGIAGYGGSPKWQRIASGLARCGYPTFRFSHGGCGDSGGSFEETTLSGRILELRAAMDAMAEEIGAKAFALIGASFGGVASLYCASDSRVKCSMIAGTPSNFDFFKDMFIGSDIEKDEKLSVDGRQVNRAIIDDVAAYSVLDETAGLKRLLVLHGEKDELIPVSHADAIYARAAEPKKIAIIPGADHAFTNGEHHEIMLDYCIDWLQKFLKI